MHATQSFAPSSPPTAAAHALDREERDRVSAWRLRGASEELMCVAVVTSRECRLLLELDGEPLLLQLRCDIENLAAKAGRLEAWLASQGWQRITGH